MTRPEYFDEEAFARFFEQEQKKEQQLPSLIQAKLEAFLLTWNGKPVPLRIVLGELWQVRSNRRLVGTKLKVILRESYPQLQSKKTWYYHENQDRTQETSLCCKAGVHFG